MRALDLCRAGVAAEYQDHATLVRLTVIPMQIAVERRRACERAPGDCADVRTAKETASFTVSLR